MILPSIAKRMERSMRPSFCIFGLAAASLIAFSARAQLSFPPPVVPDTTAPGGSKMNSPTKQTDTRVTSIRTIVAASAIGTTIEWYDFLIYATAASLVLNKLFFPTEDPLVGKLIVDQHRRCRLLRPTVRSRHLQPFRRSPGPKVASNSDDGEYGPRNDVNRPPSNLR